MARTLTATGLALSTALCGAAVWLFAQLYVKSAFSDSLMLILAAAFVAATAGMWLAFRAGRHGLAWVVAAAPPLLSVALLSQVRAPIF